MKHKMVFTLLFITLFVSVYGLIGYGDSEVAVPLDETLPVQLSSFTASVLVSGFVQLMWVSETETNMLGYNVFRSDSDKLAEAFAVNSTTIPAKNSSVTTNYNFIDENVQSGYQYYYWLQTVDLDLTNEFHGPISVQLEEEGEDGSISPANYTTKLKGAYPNPFNPGTYINFSVEKDALVTITIYNTRGQVIKILINEQLFIKGRSHSVYWDGRDLQGDNATSGVYFYVMQTNHKYRAAKKMLLMK